MINNQEVTKCDRCHDTRMCLYVGNEWICVKCLQAFYPIVVNSDGTIIQGHQRVLK